MDVEEQQINLIKQTTKLMTINNRYRSAAFWNIKIESTGKRQKFLTGLEAKYDDRNSVNKLK